MRAVFDRMLGNSSSARQQNSKPAPRKQTQHTVPPIRQDSGNPQELYLATASGLITVQLLPKYPSPKKAFGAIMTNKRASGYLFGFHDSLLQHQGLRDQNNQSQAVELMEMSYRQLFGQQAGYVLFSSALNSQDDTEFAEGRINGGNELVAFLEKEVPPFGLGRILILGMKS